MTRRNSRTKADLKVGLYLVVVATALLAPAAPLAQARRTTPTAVPAAMRTDAAKVTCPQVLGQGLQTGRIFCDVIITRDPAEGIIVALPPHAGAVTLTFDLHNRHTYSEELAKTSRGYRRYTAMVGLLASDNTPLGRAVVSSEFRNVKDLFDRISGGSGPGGVKAVAPTGAEPVTVVIPADEPTESVSIVGLKLTESRIDGTEPFLTSGRPVAIISNVMLEYRPAPPPRTPTRRK
jgi:hypothetical protein